MPAREDINQHFEQLRRLLVKLGYPHPIDKDRICAGITTELLPLLHYGLLSHSKLLATFISDAGYSLYRQNDLKFTEGVYKLLRCEFKHNPVLQCAQFLTDKGFAKRKMQFVVTCLKLAIAKHHELAKQQRLKSQHKVSWKNTNLAKKLEQAIHDKHAHSKQKGIATNTASKQSQIKKAPKVTKKKMIVKPPTKTCTQTAPAPKSIIAEQIAIEQPLLNEAHNDALNDSLTADEIRSDLPTPIAVNATPTEHVQQRECVALEHVDENEEDEESQDEHKEHEVEEKAMEMTQDTAGAQHEDAVDESMQIPQHQYDMQLIPEYDPNKYTAPQSTTDGGNEEMKITAGDHYNASYLDNFSTLMDIPQAYLQPDPDHEHAVPSRPLSASAPIAGNSGSEQKAQETANVAGFSSSANNAAVHQTQHRQQDDDDDDEEDEEDDRERADEQNQENEDEEHDDDDDDEEEEEKQRSWSTSSKSKEEAMMNRMMRKMEQLIKSETGKINARLDLMEYRLQSLEAQQPANANASKSSSLTATNGEQSSGHSLPTPVPIPSHHSSSTASRQTPTANVHQKRVIPSSLPSGVGSQSPSFPAMSASSKPSTASSSSSSEKHGVNVHAGPGPMESFTESTIGSSSLPTSLTPVQIRNSHRNGVQTETRQIAAIGSNIAGYPRQARNMFATAATSPFLPSTANVNVSGVYACRGFGVSSIASYSALGSSQFGSGASMRSLSPTGAGHVALNFNPMSALMQYPQSQTASVPPPHIDTPSVYMSMSGKQGGEQEEKEEEEEEESSNQEEKEKERKQAEEERASSNDPDNTRDFLADLKAMLNDTDALLRTNMERSRVHVYDANL